MSGLARILLRLAVTALAVWLAATLFQGYVAVADVQAAILFSIVLGLLNAFVRPVLFLLTLPFTLITLGLFIVILNATAGGGGSEWVRGRPARRADGQYRELRRQPLPAVAASP
jgi:hypothetical protein